MLARTNSQKNQALIIRQGVFGMFTKKARIISYHFCNIKKFEKEIAVARKKQVDDLMLRAN